MLPPKYCVILCILSSDNDVHLSNIVDDSLVK